MVNMLLIINYLNMESKYYIPEISEFHYGFECEFCSAYQEFSNDDNWEKGFFWNKRELNRQGSFDFDLRDLKSTLDYNQWRVKYLDREDIESLGFKYDNELKFPQGLHTDKVVEFVKGEYCLSTINNKGILITRYKDGLFDKLFDGNIKNKSELKKLLKQLQIS